MVPSSLLGLDIELYLYSSTRLGTDTPFSSSSVDMLSIGALLLLNNALEDNTVIDEYVVPFNVLLFELADILLYFRGQGIHVGGFKREQVFNC